MSQLDRGFVKRAQTAGTTPGSGRPVAVVGGRSVMVMMLPTRGLTRDFARAGGHPHQRARSGSQPVHA